MGISRILNRPFPPNDWNTWSKIPWDEPEFSMRMLENHISQEHDWASRTNVAIDAQTAFIHQVLPSNARVLDLGCGPGLYTSRLSALGHSCTGVDFSPASINYACALPGADRIAYIQKDIRRFQPTELFDAVLLLFGEINAFSQQDSIDILTNAVRALRPGGRVFIEVHTREAICDIGKAPATWHTAANGLFSAKPHLFLEEHFWNETFSIAMTRYYIQDAASGEVAEYAALMQGYSEQEYEELFAKAGLTRNLPVCSADWPVGAPFAGKLRCVVCSAPVKTP